MGVRYPGRASIDPGAPEAVGVCDRCGFLYSLRDLRYQPIYAGPTTLVTTRRVCTITCWDVPNEQLRTIRIPPDPMPVSDPRIENFAVDEANHLTLQKAPVGKLSMFLGAGSMSVELEHRGALAPLAFEGVGVVDGILQRGVNIPATFDGVGVMDADLELVSPFAPFFDGVGVMDGVLQLGLGVSALLDGVGVMDADLFLDGPVRTITQVGSQTANDSNSVTCPSVQAGDLIVCLQRARGVTLPAAAQPSGFTIQANASLTDCRQILSTKIAVGTEGGTSLSGMVSDAGAIGSMWICVTFRGVYPATTQTVQDVASQMTDAAPTNQTANASGSALPLVVFGAFGGGSIGTISFTPAQDGSFSATGTFAGVIELRYKIYNSSPADVTVTKNDSGTRNTLQSCYIELSN